ncbi:MAG: hypothetical protein IJ223_06965 [Clostridia bacterium]|nr:hypothetical protein [Clostridia bacterium]
MGDNLSPADIKAVVDGNNNGFAYPVYPYGGGFGNSGFGNDGSWIWIILILALLGGFNGNGNGFGGGFGNDYAWLSNGQKDIMTNTNNGFNTLHLSDQVEGVRDGIYGLSNQLCNCCADMNQTVSNGFYNAEIGANNRQMANMQQSFNNQIATLQGFNNLSSDLASCCCENRLGIANLNSTILAENCADRAALADGLKDVLINQTANTQRILDQLCSDKIDAKNEKIADLQRELQMADLKASQIEQNAFIAQGFSNEVDQLYNRLSSCPVPSTPVYGRTPIFTCNSGCGCGNAFGNTIV